MEELEIHYGPTPEPSPMEGALWFATTSGLLHEFEDGHWRPATPQRWGQAFRALNENALAMAGMMVQAFRLADAAADIARNTTGVAGWNDDGTTAPWATFTPDFQSEPVHAFLDEARSLVHRCEDALRGTLPDHNTERCEQPPEVADD